MTIEQIQDRLKQIFFDALNEERDILKALSAINYQRKMMLCHNPDETRRIEAGFIKFSVWYKDTQIEASLKRLTEEGFKYGGSR